MKYSPVITSIYALMILTGGIIGFVKAGSIPSITMATIFALLLSLSAYASWQRKSFGDTAAMVITFILTVFFLFRFFKTGAFMPAGFTFILSLFVLALLYKMKNAVTRV